MSEYKYCSALTSDGFKEWLAPIDNPDAEPIDIPENKDEYKAIVVRQCSHAKVIRVVKS